MSINIQRNQKKRVVIVGGGLGGLRLAEDLYGSGMQEVLIDKNNFHQFPPLIYQIASAGIDPSSISFPFRQIFRKRKDKYRRWRDMGVFVMIGVYAFSVIDAYVDASLSEFDISDDLTLRVEPTVLNDKRTNNPFKSTSLGLQCSLRF